MSILFALLSIVDILGGVFLVFGGMPFLGVVALYVGYIILIKGLGSLLTGVPLGGFNVIFIIFSIIDILAGASLVMNYYRIFLMPSFILGVLILLKGIYSFFASFA